MKKRLGVIYGGKSLEHEVSIQSAQGIMSAVDTTRFEIVPLLIDHEGVWHRQDTGESMSIYEVADKCLRHLDVIFPVIHGATGEDGVLQGFLEMLEIPYVGAGVIGSAIGMDKDVTKRLCRDAGIPIPGFTVVHKDTIDWDSIENEVSYPCVVKPTNMGSSIGLKKALVSEELLEGIEEAFGSSPKVIIEEYIEGREVECSVLEGESLFVSTLGEILPKDGMYTFENKYVYPDGAQFFVPAKLKDETLEAAQEIAVQAFRALDCEGMARVDMFITEDERVLLNEINTIPGFTPISLYPRLWKESGLTYEELVDALIEHAQQRFEKKSALTASA